jgi:3-methyladenine DNA glycosylase AlkD
MNPEQALDALRARIEPGRAAEMAAYHKQNRVVLGVSNPSINALTREWRKLVAMPQRIVLARALWASDIFEARIAAAKLFDQAKIKDDAAVWGLISSWVPDFDSWAIADHVCKSGGFRLQADLHRLDEVEGWTHRPHMWSRRAALVMTLFLASAKSEAFLAERDRALTWAARLADDPDWFIQKAIGWWLRTLSAHHPDRVRSFMAEHGLHMKAFARKEALRHLTS